MLTSMTFRNPQATMPLVVDFNVECNTPTETIYANVIKNANLPNRWVEKSEAHDGVAVICASGPSMVDTVGEARIMQAYGAKLFAMNGCARFLGEHGIIPDYQVIMDARPENLALVGPAKEHLFASQCAPVLFEHVPNAIVWHATHGNQLPDEQDGFPDRDHFLVGSSVSVGCTALGLIYAMGYRQIHVFGMDSSHKEGAGHAFEQKLNADDPLTIVEYKGREYVCSFTMKAQADAFLGRLHELEINGCKVVMHGDGLLQDMVRNPLSEQEKYEQMWSHADYREVSPGEAVAKTFLEVAQPKAGDKVVDFGCGTGRGALAIAEHSDCDLTLVDFTENSRDAEARSFPFIRADLTKPIPVRGDYGFCCDVMEHIHPKDVERVIRNLFRCTKQVFFQISLVHASMGYLIGQPLHLTVANYAWWMELFQSLGYSVVWSKDEGISAMFYVQPLGE